MSTNKNDDNPSSVKKENKYVKIIQNKVILNFGSENTSNDENAIQSNDSVISKNDNVDDVSLNEMNEKTENDETLTIINNVNNSKEIPNELHTNQINQNNILNNNNINYAYSSNKNINDSVGINSN